MRCAACFRSTCTSGRAALFLGADPFGDTSCLAKRDFALPVAAAAIQLRRRNMVGARHFRPSLLARAGLVQVLAFTGWQLGESANWPCIIDA